MQIYTIAHFGQQSEDEKWQAEKVIEALAPRFNANCRPGGEARPCTSARAALTRARRAGKGNTKYPDGHAGFPTRLLLEGTSEEDALAHVSKTGPSLLDVHTRHMEAERSRHAAGSSQDAPEDERNTTLDDFNRLTRHTMGLRVGECASGTD